MTFSSLKSPVNGYSSKFVIEILIENGFIDFLINIFRFHIVDIFSIYESDLNKKHNQMNNNDNNCNRNRYSNDHCRSAADWRSVGRAVDEE